MTGVAAVAPNLSEVEADELLSSVFPEGLPPARGRGGVASAIVDAYPLEEHHIHALATHVTTPGAKLGVTAEPLMAVRHTHHKLARLLALGMDETKAAHICNYNVSRVSILKTDPLFVEVLNYYTAQVNEQFVDVVEVMKGLSLDALGEITERLHNNPQAFTVAQLIELVKTTADRSGAGPTSNHNVNARVLNLTPDDIERIKNVGDASVGQARIIPPEDRATLAACVSNRPADAGAPTDEEVEERPTVGEGSVGAATGNELREEDRSDAEAVDAIAALPPMDQF